MRTGEKPQTKNHQLFWACASNKRKNESLQEIFSWIIIRYFYVSTVMLFVSNILKYCHFLKNLLSTFWGDDVFYIYIYKMSLSG